MPNEAITQTPWMLPASQWIAGLDLVLFSAIDARRSYPKSLGF